MNYQDFLKGKQHLSGNFGFEAKFIPDIAFDFQEFIIEKAVKKAKSRFTHEKPVTLFDILE